MLPFAGGGIVVQVTASTLIECTFMGATGPLSWYSSCPFGLPASSAEAFPPKFALSPFWAVIHPPYVMSTVQNAVLGGTVHTFVAGVHAKSVASHGRPSLSVSTQ